MPTPERITIRTILNELLLMANLEKGIGYTIKALALFPGRAIREYLFENRDRMTKPFSFLVLTVAVATFVTTQLLIGDEGLWQEVKKDLEGLGLSAEAAVLLKWFSTVMNKYMNLFFISSLPFLALGTYLFFGEKRYNFAEHLVINSYIYSYQTVLFIIFAPFVQMANWVGFLFVSALTAYTFFAYIRTFEQRFWPGVWKSIGVYFLSQTVSSFVIAIIVAIAWLWLKL